MLTVLDQTVPKPGAIQHVDLILSVEQLIVHKRIVLEQTALILIALQTLQ